MSYTQSVDQKYLNKYPQISPYFNDIDAEFAARAFYNTSFHPERRGASVRASYAQDLLDAKPALIKQVERAIMNGADVPEDWKEEIDLWFIGFKQGLKSKYQAYLSAHSNCISSFITGPANFPVNRAQKANNSADNRWNELVEFKEKSVKGCLKSLMPYGDGSVIRSDDPNASGKLDKEIGQLEKQRDFMKKCNAIARKYKKDKQACIEKLMEFTGYKSQVIEKMLEPNYAGRVIPFESYQLTNLGANIRRLQDRAKEVEVTQSIEIDDQFENGISVSISEDQKIVIDFGFKPSEEVRSILKSNAFKWSPKRVAWVRMVTANALRSYRDNIKPMLKNLEV